jgi:glutamyl-tRNA reductase
MKLFVAGVSHKTAPVEVREQLAVTPSHLVDAAEVLKLFGHLDEVVLLSTCNRVEIYGTTERESLDIKSLFQLLSAEAGELDDHIYVHENNDAIRHLFRVAAGLDSMVLGETEITGQLKKAYETARVAGLTGRVLNRLFQKALRATKEIRTSTGIGRGPVSIKGTTVRLIQTRCGDLSQQSVLVIGAGQTAECCARLLADKNVGSLTIATRSFDRALDLAMQCGGEAACFGDCLLGIGDFDVVITATSSAQTLLSRDDLANVVKARHDRPLLLIDLSVPRNIEPTVSDLDNVSLYNIDHLEEIARAGLQARQQHLSPCYEIIETYVAALSAKIDAENKRLSDEQRKNQWMPDPFASSSILLPTAA